ncbi:uncharacterized protein JCM15063_005305 [Sporobolomyces koalae]|uniref:uncharacterized protein n=1 Tax=Sporobolomyces koalae TaxID=500713 RepID=UPI00317E481B
MTSSRKFLSPTWLYGEGTRIAVLIVLSVFSTLQVGNRLAGLPKIPKINKKKPSKAPTSTGQKSHKKAQKTDRKLASSTASLPVKKDSTAGPSPTSAKPAVSSSSASKTAKKPSKASSSQPTADLPFPINPSDDDTLSEPESSSSSSDSSSDSDDAEDDASDVENRTERNLDFPAFSNLVLPPLPPLPPLPTSLPPTASSSSSTPISTPRPSTSTHPSTSKPSPANQPPPSASSSSRSKPPKSQASAVSHASASTSNSASSAVASSSRSKPSTLPLDDLAFTPTASTSTSSRPSIADHSGPASSAASGTGPQRMSLRQVLALSLQEAEEQQKNSRDNTPDAQEIMNLAKGSHSHKKKKKNGDRSNQFKGNRASDSDTSSAGSSIEGSDDDDEEDEEPENEVAVGSMEKEEERLLRQEIEKRKRIKGKQVALNQDANLASIEDEGDEDEDEDEDLVDAWDKNVRAMEQIRKKRYSFGGGGGISFEKGSDDDDGGDSDIAVTEVPPGNGFGVVTWSDYDSFGTSEDEDDDNDDDDEIAGLDQLVKASLANDQRLAGEFEDELEQLFALSEAVVGPIRQDEYERGDMWFEALSDDNGSTADDEIDYEGDDLDAEMVFGENGELKRLFGTRRKRKFAAFESSAGETDTDDDDDATQSEAGDDDVELVRVGIRLDSKRPRGSDESDEEETDSYDSEDDETESSCSDTDIYRYAPRTGALSNLQAPTTADLASLDEPDSSSNPKPPFAPAPSTLEVPTFNHAKGKVKAELPTFKRRAPKMGTFDTNDRKPNVEMESAGEEAGLSIVVVAAGDEPAPSPFRVPPKESRRRASRPNSPRRVRAESRVSTTSATSGSTSLDPGSNIGSPVFGNVVLPDFDFDSLLQESLFEASDSNDDDATLREPPLLVLDAATSSETDTATTTVLSKPLAPDFARWNRIPIGAYRTRTMGGANGRSAPSQVLTAQAAATEQRKNRKKRRNSTATAETVSRKKISGGRRGTSGEEEVASSILRDHKAVKNSLRHTLGTSPAVHSSSQKGEGRSSKKAIRSRMLTSPVLAPTIPSSKSTASGSTSTMLSSNKRKKRSKSPGTKTAASSRMASRQNSVVPSTATSTSHLAPSVPTANLPPLHSPLFSKLEL